MEYKGDVGKYLSGSQILIPKCGIYVTQPKIKDIIQFGETEFSVAVQFLDEIDSFAAEIKSGNNQLKDIDNFQLVLEAMRVNEFKEIKNDLDILFKLICPDFVVKYSKDSIDFLITEDDNQKIKGRVTAFNYKDLATVLNELFSPRADKKNEFNPANEAAKKIAEKLEAARIKNKKKSKESSSLFGTMCSILSIGLSMDINLFMNYTPFQLYDCFERYLAKMQYDLYQKIMLTPFMERKEDDDVPEMWTKDLYT